MRRREFIAGISAAAWPVVAWGQQQRLPVVGYLNAGYSGATINFVAAFRKGLSETGFSEGRNLAIEYRFAENQFDWLPELVAELVHRQMSVIAVLGGGLVAALAAKAATATIPIVFGIGDNPVEAGLVASLNRPGGNLTGTSFMIGELAPKRLELLHEMLPQATRFAMLVDPNSVKPESTIKAAEMAATALGGRMDVLSASTNHEIDAAFATAVQKRTEGILINGSQFFVNRRVQLATLAVHHAMPVIYYDRVFAESGGLMSYGSNVLDQNRQVGVYTGRILKGEKPSDLPVMQPTKFEFVINLQIARTLGIEVPAGLLAIADEMIE